MNRRILRPLVGLVVLMLIGATVTQVAQAASYYWRWVTPLPTVTCTLSGSDITVLYKSLNIEWNLPVGATRNSYEYTNGSLTKQNTDSTFAGSSGSFPFNAAAVPTSGYPLTYMLHLDTIVDGKAVYRSTITVNCTGDGAGTVTIVNEDLSNSCLALPDGSVMGDLPFQTQAYYAPGKVSPGVFLNPGTYWVIGEDDSGQYYKIILSCQYLWVPVDSMQPSYQPPWSGQPLPTRVVD